MHEPVLHARGATIVTAEVDPRACIDTLWGPGWRDDMHIRWDEKARGPLGYTLPESYHLFWLRHGSEEWVAESNMYEDGARFDLGCGMYDIFIYNNDFLDLLLSHDLDWGHALATTPADATLHLPDSLGLAHPLMEMPEQLYSLFASNLYVSDKLEDYEYLPRENIYVCRFAETLLPRTFIYIVQLELANNHGRVTQCTHAVVDGLAADTDMISGLTSSEPAACHLGMSMQEVTDSAGQARHFACGRLTTFGLPGIVPWNGTRATVRPAGDVANTLFTELHYRTGARRFVKADLTEQMRARPAGGVLHVVIDIDLYPPPVTPQPPEQGGGIQVDVSNWDEENHAVRI